jgi:hypothetical protein
LILDVKEIEMVKRKIALKTWLAIVVGVGTISASIMDANTRMGKVSELFTKYGLNTFQLLNGQDIGGTGGTGEGKVAQQSQRSDIAATIHSEDPNTFLFCVADSKWVVYQAEPTKVGQSAMTMTDVDGKPFVASQIAAMKESSDGKAVVPYTAKTLDGVREDREAVIWSSKNLLKRKNDTGQKFYCGTSRLRASTH